MTSFVTSQASEFPHPEMEDVKPDLKSIAAEAAAAADAVDELVANDTVEEPVAKEKKGYRPEAEGWLCGFCGATFAHRSEFKVNLEPNLDQIVVFFNLPSKLFPYSRDTAFKITRANPSE